MAKGENRMIRRRLANAYLSSVVSISLVLLLVGVASLLLVNTDNVSDYFKENMKVSVLMMPEVSDAQAMDYQAVLDSMPFIRGTEFISRAQGEQEMARMLGKDFLSVFETSPIPVSVDVTLAADYVSDDSLKVVSQRLSASPLVDEVVWQKSLVDALGANLARISMVLGIFIVLLLFISFVLIGNTMRLSVYARRFTIHTMKMVGATKNFIRGPFLLNSALLGLFSSLVAILLSPLLLRVSGANQEVFSEALLYFRIYLVGLPFTVTYNSGAGALRALGDSQSPFLALALTSVINVALDLLLTGLLRMGIVGVAVATVISQGISVAFICHRLRCRIGGRCFALKETFSQGKPILAEAFNIGFWAGMQSALISFSNLFVWRYINRFSTLQVAGVSIATRVDKFVNLPIKAYGMAMVTLVGQNRGRQNGARIREGIWRCVWLSLLTWVLFGVVIYLGAPRIAAIFNREETVIETAVAFMHTLIPFYCVMAMREILLGVLRGFGRSTGPMVVTLIGMVGIRQLYLYLVMRPGADIRLLFYGYPLGWLSATILLLIYALIIRTKLQV